MLEQLTAIIWDFDGTLVDTRQKNLNVTRTLTEELKGHSADRFEALRSLVHYERALQRHQDWRGFYGQELEMTEVEVLAAGSRWAEYQLADDTEAPSYDGVPEVLEQLSHLPQGIVSLNSRQNILRFLEQLALHHLFQEVIGYEAFEPHRHKPAPDALVSCIESLTGLRPGRVVYVGDHESDARCVDNTNAYFRDQRIDVDVVSVGAFYAPFADDSGWSTRPHYRAEDPRQILGVVEQLTG